MQHRFRGHIILCLLADENSPQMGLVHFLMPLRSVNIDLTDLKACHWNHNIRSYIT